MACLECRGKRWCSACGNPELFGGVERTGKALAKDRKAELVAKLKEIRERLGNDPEVAHGEADRALIEFIGDEEVKEAFESLITWYA